MKADPRKRIEKSRTLFAETVVSGRNHPALDIQAVLDTEAGLFGADEAVPMGLADRVGSLDQLLDGFPAAAAMRRPMAGFARVAATPLLAPAPVEPITAIAESAPAPTALAIDPAHAAAQGTGGMAAERARIGTILTDPLAQGAGRTLAEHLAYGTDMTADQAIAALGAGARDWARADANRQPTLAEEMAADIQPNVGTDGGVNPAGMTDAQRGAFAAALVLGKDVQKAVAEAGGVAPSGIAPEPPEFPGSSPTAQTWRRPL